jgi:glutamate formiminotransferase / 5-formyltetrahydrofolate cyclo-ligase
VIDPIARAFVRDGVRLLDLHSDGDHQRSVVTLAGHAGSLVPGLIAGAGAAIERIDIRDRRGAHPHVGALDVMPLVYLEPSARGAACAAALVVAEEIGTRLRVPVFLYGELAGGRTRAELRRGGFEGLARRAAAGRCRPDFGPRELHVSAGATLVAARAPLVAFNLELAAPAGVSEARRIAALIREGGERGLTGVRAIGVALRDGRVGQVSVNVEQPLLVPLAQVVRAVSEHAEVAAAELVGLAPRAALRDFPADLPMRGFDPARQVIENALGF